MLEEYAFQIDDRNKVTIEKETIDFAGLEFGGQIEGEIAKSLSMPMIAQLDAELIDMLQAQLILNGNGAGAGAQTTPGYIINSKFSNTRVEAEFNDTFFDITDLSGNLRGTVDRKVMGTGKPDVFNLGNLFFMSRLAMATKSGSLGAQQLQSGEYQLA